VEVLTDEPMSGAEVTSQLRGLGVTRGGVLLGVGHDANTTLHLGEGRVGRAHARLAKSRDIVAAALENLSRDPLLFLHPISAGCEECAEARQSAGAAPFIKNTG
jgi:aminoglycoside N3'-acetyltransferase